MEQKKRQLEENVDSLNEELVKLSAQGTLLEELVQSHMINIWDLTDAFQFQFFVPLSYSIYNKHQRKSTRRQQLIRLTLCFGLSYNKNRIRIMMKPVPRLKGI